MNGMTYMRMKKLKTLGQRETNSSKKRHGMQENSSLKYLFHGIATVQFIKKREKNAACSYLDGSMKKKEFGLLFCEIFENTQLEIFSIKVTHTRAHTYECFEPIFLSPSLSPFSISLFWILNYLQAFWMRIEKHVARHCVRSIYDLFIDFKVLIRDCCFCLILSSFSLSFFVMLVLLASVFLVFDAKSLNFKKQIKISKNFNVCVWDWKNVCLLSYSGKVKCVSF